MTDEAQPLDDPSGAIPEPVETRPASPPIAQRLDGTDCRSFAFAGAIAFTGYLCTLAPDVTLEWSGLMATSANYAAPSAPPGYPVWTLYSWLCAHLIPFSNIAWRVAVGSAVASAVAEQARAAGTALAGNEVGFAPGDTVTGGAGSTQVSDRRV